MTPGNDEGGVRRRITRRQVLAGAAATGMGALAGCSGTAPTSTVTTAAGVAPAGSDLGAVEHVIFLMMENRSFDHYYGTYPGVRGFDDHSMPTTSEPFSQACPVNTSAAPDRHTAAVPPRHRGHDLGGLHVRPHP